MKPLIEHCQKLNINELTRSIKSELVKIKLLHLVTLEMKDPGFFARLAESEWLHFINHQQGIFFSVESVMI